METNENEGKKQVCETVQLLITEVVCGSKMTNSRIDNCVFNKKYKQIQFLVLD